MANSTKAGPPQKPHPDFPLTPRKDGRWAKKVRGKVHIFAGDADAALEEWLRVKDDLLAGRPPRPAVDGVTVRDLVNAFLASKRQLADAGEIQEKTWADYYRCCAKVINVFGRTRSVIDLTADDFEQLRSHLSKTRGPVGLANEIQRVRVLFKYAYDQGLIDRPIRYGQNFRRPSKRVLRLARQVSGPRMFEAAELKELVDAAGVQLKAMILLGINCGFGNTDVATLPLTAIDLKAGWVDFPRPKTGIQRRVPLWPETVKALKDSIAKRRTPKQDGDSQIVFVTKYGERWVRFRYVLATEKKKNAESWTDSVGLEFGKLLKDHGIKRPGLGFYALRHTFETIGGDARDQVAVDHIMGHAPNGNDMSAVYRERISDERLKAVTDHVHAWLFPKEKKKGASRKHAKPGDRAKSKASRRKAKATS